MMLTLHRTLLAAGVAVTVLVTACGTGPTELTVDPAAAPARSVERTEEPAGPLDEQADETLDETVDETVDAPDVEAVEDLLDGAVDEADGEPTGGAVAEPKAGAAAKKAPKRETTTRTDPPSRSPASGTPRTPAPPESGGIVIDGDGCAVDVATGLVLTCADPAAGPDEGTAEFCAIDPSHVSCSERSGR
jgi:hypothetical protein